MSLLTYKVLHILGMMLVFSSLGGLIFHSLAGGGAKHRGHKLAGASHGIGLVLILVSGFGMLAKLQAGFPLWVIAKVVIWLLFGGVIALIRRMPGQATTLWLALPLLGAAAAYLALFKPF